MRIIAGELSGRVFNSPGTSKTHPMGDRMKGALFNILGDIEGLTILDAFAGSGALGFEAASRGAQKVVLLDSDRQAQKVIAQNIKDLNLSSSCKLISTSAEAWARLSDEYFDIILLDPPYNDLQPETIVKMTAKAKTEAIIVLSWPDAQEAPVIPDAQKLTERSYANGKLIFYRHN